MITYEEVSEWLEYNPDTGNLYWLKKPNRRIRVGDVAGSKAQHRKHNWYYNLKVCGKRLKVHRVAWLLYYGELPNDMMIDHIDGNGLNNKIDNLRLATPAQNQYNRRKQQEYPGTQKRGNRYIARIQQDRKKIYIGTYDTREEAHFAYLKKSRELRGEFSK